MSPRLQLWLHGLGSAFIGGAASTITNMIVAPETFNINEGLYKVITAAGVAGIVSAAFYLKSSPLPGDVPTLPPDLKR